MKNFSMTKKKIDQKQNRTGKEKRYIDKNDHKNGVAKLRKVSKKSKKDDSGYFENLLMNQDSAFSRTHDYVFQANQLVKIEPENSKELIFYKIPNEENQIKQQTTSIDTSANSPEDFLNFGNKPIFAQC